MNPKVELVFNILINGLKFVAGCMLLYAFNGFSTSMSLLGGIMP